MLGRVTIICLSLIISISLLSKIVIPHHHHHDEICVEAVHCSSENNNHNSNNHEHHNSTDDSQCFFYQIYLAPVDNSKKQSIYISFSFRKQVSSDYLSVIYNLKTGSLLGFNVINTLPLIIDFYHRYEFKNVGLRAPPTLA